MRNGEGPSNTAGKSSNSGYLRRGDSGNLGGGYYGPFNASAVGIKTEDDTVEFGYAHRSPLPK